MLPISNYFFFSISLTSAAMCNNCPERQARYKSYITCTKYHKLYQNSAKLILTDVSASQFPLMKTIVLQHVTPFTQSHSWKATQTRDIVFSQFCCFVMNGHQQGTSSDRRSCFSCNNKLTSVVYKMFKFCWNFPFALSSCVEMKSAGNLTSGMNNIIHNGTLFNGVKPQDQKEVLFSFTQTFPANF